MLTVINPLKENRERKDQNTECVDERRRRYADKTGEIDFSGKKALVMNR